MRTGRLRHRVTIQQATQGAADAHGETESVWADYAIGVPAEVRTLSGVEAQRAAQVSPGATVQVTMRYCSDLTPAMRLIFGSRTLNVVAIMPGERTTQPMIVLCGEEL